MQAVEAPASPKLHHDILWLTMNGKKYGGFMAFQKDHENSTPILSYNRKKMSKFEFWDFHEIPKL